MGIKLLLNDYYDLLKLMHDNEAIILDEKVKLKNLRQLTIEH
jgi:hypothetical protein